MGAPPAVQRRGHPTPHHTSIGGGLRRNPHRLQRGCLCVCGGTPHTTPHHITRKDVGGHHTTSTGRYTKSQLQGAHPGGAETNTYLCIYTHVHLYTYIPLYRKIKICIHNYVYANTTPHYKETWEGGTTPHPQRGEGHHTPPHTTPEGGVGTPHHVHIGVEKHHPPHHNHRGQPSTDVGIVYIYKYMYMAQHPWMVPLCGCGVVGGVPLPPMCMWCGVPIPPSGVV